MIRRLDKFPGSVSFRLCSCRQFIIKPNNVRLGIDREFRAFKRISIFRILQNHSNCLIWTEMKLRSALLSAALVLMGWTAAPAQAETSIEISLKNRYLTLFDDGRVIGAVRLRAGDV